MERHVSAVPRIVLHTSILPIIEHFMPCYAPIWPAVTPVLAFNADPSRRLALLVRRSIVGRCSWLRVSDTGEVGETRRFFGWSLSCYDLRGSDLMFEERLPTDFSSWVVTRSDWIQHMELLVEALSRWKRRGSMYIPCVHKWANKV
jgi:hypothetical protein